MGRPAAMGRVVAGRAISSMPVAESRSVIPSGDRKYFQLRTYVKNQDYGPIYGTASRCVKGSSISLTWEFLTGYSEIIGKIAVSDRGTDSAWYRR